MKHSPKTNVIHSSEVQPWKDVLAFFVPYKILLLVMTIWLIPLLQLPYPTGTEDFADRLVQWDAVHILTFADLGYLQDHPNIQIFPIFPLLVRFLTPVFENTALAALLLTQLFSFFTFLFLYKLARLRLPRDKAWASMILFAFFPTAFFLSVPYTESLAYALVFASAYYFLNKRPVTSGVLGALACLTRIGGFVLIPAMLVSLCLERRTQPRQMWLSPVLAGLGPLIYFGLNIYYYGSWDFFLHYQVTAWDHEMSLPFYGLFTYLEVVSFDGADPAVFTGLLMAVVAVLTLVSFYPLLIAKRWFEVAFLSGAVILHFSMDPWMSEPRYFLILFPVFISLGQYFARPKWLNVYSCFGLLGVAVLLGRYINSEWAF